VRGNCKDCPANRGDNELCAYNETLIAAAALVESLTTQLATKTMMLDAAIARQETFQGEIKRQDEKIARLTEERDESQRREKAAADMINRLEKDITVISGASDYIKPGTGVWHTIGIMLQAIENWRDVGEGEMV
jgi:chromosome segregation ATPase